MPPLACTENLIYRLGREIIFGYRFMSSRNLAVEAIAVGSILAVLYLIIRAIVLLNIIPASWSWLRQPAVWVFLAGACGHLILEQLGLNAAFCRMIV